MSFADTVSQDYQIAGYDGGSTATFTAVRSGASTNYTITYADDHELSLREIAAGGGFYQQGDKRWSLGAALITVAADRPQPGDYITDAGGVVWHILDTVLDDLGISWFCTTRKAR